NAASTQQNAPSSPLQRPMDKNSQFRHEPSRKMIGLRKDLSEVLAFVRPDGLTYRTLRGALSPNVKPRGRGQFQLLRLAFAGVLLLMPGTIREIQKTRLATLALDGLSVIARTRRRVQGGVDQG